MKFPEIPTDNLYKFMAISGIILFIAAFLPVVHSFKLKVESIRLNGEIETLQKEIEWASSCINNSKKKKQSEDIEMQRKQVISQIQLNTKIQEHERLVRMQKAEIKFSWFALGLGSFLIVYGFKLWHEKLQKPRDIILLNKVKKISQNNK
jgi:hypothetical protein